MSAVNLAGHLQRFFTDRLLGPISPKKPLKERFEEFCLAPLRSAPAALQGRANATYASPVGPPSFPPPVAAITTNWRPSDS